MESKLRSVRGLFVNVSFVARLLLVQVGCLSLHPSVIFEVGGVKGGDGDTSRSGMEAKQRNATTEATLRMAPVSSEHSSRQGAF